MSWKSHLDIKDIWWTPVLGSETNKASCTQHDLGSFASSFSSTPPWRWFQLILTLKEWLILFFSPANFRNIDLEVNTAGEFTPSRSADDDDVIASLSHNACDKVLLFRIVFIKVLESSTFQAST